MINFFLIKISHISEYTCTITYVPFLYGVFVTIVYGPPWFLLYVLFLYYTSAGHLDSVVCKMLVTYNSYDLTQEISYSFERFGLWYYTPLSTIFQLYCGGKFYYWRKSEYPVKTTDLWQVTDKLYDIMLYQVHLTINGLKLTYVVVIGTDCIGSCKYNYHTIKATTALSFKRLSYTFQQTTVKPVLCDLPKEYWNRVIWDRWLLNTGLINLKCTVKGN